MFPTAEGSLTYFFVVLFVSQITLNWWPNPIRLIAVDSRPIARCNPLLQPWCSNPTIDDNRSTTSLILSWRFDVKDRPISKADINAFLGLPSSARSSSRLSTIARCRMEMNNQYYRWNRSSLVRSVDDCNRPDTDWAARAESLGTFDVRITGLITSLTGSFSLRFPTPERRRAVDKFLFRFRWIQMAVGVVIWSMAASHVWYRPVDFGLWYIDVDHGNNRLPYYEAANDWSMVLIGIVFNLMLRFVYVAMYFWNLYTRPEEEGRVITSANVLAMISGG